MRRCHPQFARSAASKPNRAASKDCVVPTFREVKTGFSRRTMFLAGGTGVAGLAVEAQPYVTPAWGVPRPPLRPEVSAWSDQGLHAAWLGHSTVLIKADGF